MKLEELFLGKERLVPVKGGKKLKVRQLLGTDIFIAADGAFVLPRWQGKEEGETPHQRRGKKWSQKELGYIVYPQGLLSALRSRQLALFKAQVIGCPTYQAALVVFAEEVRKGIIIKCTMDPQKISPALRQKLQAFGFVFQRAQKTGVKEAMTKILFLYQDEERGLNVGAMLTRTVAITDRLRERLLGLYVWIRKYQAQERALLMMEAAIKKTIFKAAQQMEELGYDSAMLQGAGGKKAQRLIADRLTTLSMRLEPLKLVQPFSRWMAFVMKDFDELSKAAAKQDFILVQALTERIRFSMGLKAIQRSLDRLLLRVGQDTIIKRPDWNSYEVWTADLGERLCGLSLKEEKVGLRERVCSAAGQALREASQEAGTAHRLEPFKAAVKRAYAIL